MSVHDILTSLPVLILGVEEDQPIPMYGMEHALPLSTRISLAWHYDLDLPKS